jgi:hypothetical protein
LNQNISAERPTARSGAILEFVELIAACREGYATSAATSAAICGTGDPIAAQQLAWQTLENVRQQQVSALAATSSMVRSFGPSDMVVVRFCRLGRVANSLALNLYALRSRDILF